MRVLQLIDSLSPGGAEQMAVSYANALANRIESSFLCCTRMEGQLKNKLFPEVGYFFLEKKTMLDLLAFWRLRKFVKEKKINIIQAHSSSWFLALLVKKSLPNVKLVWHDHYGGELVQRRPGLLVPASRHFNAIISVNVHLERWARKKLKCENVTCFKNFLLKKSSVGRISQFKPLHGDGGSFKIVCVANLRPQKDHPNLLAALKRVTEEINNVTLHLIGKDGQDSYSDKLKNYIIGNKLEDKVFLYGEQPDVDSFLEQADLGVLSSASEGLPVALLEYGHSGLPVVCTAVGECPEVIGDHGKLVPAKDPEALAGALLFYLRNEGIRKKDAKKFRQKVKIEFPEEGIVPDVVIFLKVALGQNS